MKSAVGPARYRMSWRSQVFSAGLTMALLTVCSQCAIANPQATEPGTEEFISAYIWIAGNGDAQVVETHSIVLSDAPSPVTERIPLYRGRSPRDISVSCVATEYTPLPGEWRPGDSLSPGQFAAIRKTNCLEVTFMPPGGPGPAVFLLRYSIPQLAVKRNGDWQYSWPIASPTEPMPCGSRVEVSFPEGYSVKEADVLMCLDGDADAQFGTAMVLGSVVIYNSEGPIPPGSSWTVGLGPLTSGFAFGLQDFVMCEVAVGLMALIAWSLWSLRRRNQVRRLAVVPLHPPEGVPPAIASILDQPTLGAVGATTLDLARRGFLSITCRRQGFRPFGRAASYSFERTDKDDGELLRHERVLLSQLGSDATMSTADLSRLLIHNSPFWDALTADIADCGWFGAYDASASRRKAHAILMVMGLALGTGVALLNLPQLATSARAVGVAFTAVAVTTALAGKRFFRRFQPTVNEAGKRARDAWRGFFFRLRYPRFLGRDEYRDSLMTILPYAVALGCGPAWEHAAGQLTDGAPAWYADPDCGHDPLIRDLTQYLLHDVVHATHYVARGSRVSPPTVRRP